MVYIKITHLHLKSPDRRKHTLQLSTPLGTRWRIQQNSTQARLELMQQNELHHPLPQFKVILKTGIASDQRPLCFIFRSITMVEKLHQFQQPSTNSWEKQFWKRFVMNKSIYGKSFSVLDLFVLLYWFIHCSIHCE